MSDHTPNNIGHAILLLGMMCIGAYHYEWSGATFGILAFLLGLMAACTWITVEKSDYVLRLRDAHIDLVTAKAEYYRRCKS